MMPVGAHTAEVNPAPGIEKADTYRSGRSAMSGDHAANTRWLTEAARLLAAGTINTACALVRVAYRQPRGAGYPGQMCAPARRRACRYAVETIECWLCWIQPPEPAHMIRVAGPDHAAVVALAQHLCWEPLQVDSAPHKRALCGTLS